jgi:hypothetical protein
METFYSKLVVRNSNFCDRIFYWNYETVMTQFSVIYFRLTA